MAASAVKMDNEEGTICIFFCIHFNDGVLNFKVRI